MKIEKKKKKEQRIGKKKKSHEVSVRKYDDDDEREKAANVRISGKKTAALNRFIFILFYCMYDCFSFAA